MHDSSGESSEVVTVCSALEVWNMVREEKATCLSPMIYNMSLRFEVGNMKRWTQKDKEIQKYRKEAALNSEVTLPKPPWEKEEENDQKGREGLGISVAEPKRNVWRGSYDLWSRRKLR